MEIPDAGVALTDVEAQFVRSNHQWGDNDQYLVKLDGKYPGVYETLADGTACNRCDLGIIPYFGPQRIITMMQNNIINIRGLIKRLREDNDPEARGR